VENTYRIVIAEDHTILREGLKALLRAEPDLEVVGEAADGLEAIKSVEKHQPDLVLMDLSMPKMNGLEAIRDLKRRMPATRIVALTVHKSDEYVLATLEAGADAYVLKEATHSELMIAVTNVLSGKRYLSPGVSQQVIEGYLKGKRDSKKDLAYGRLTKREREVLKLIAEGYRNREVADYLCISSKTVEKHRANLMKKLDLHNAAALTGFAIEKGLVNR
jgi:DNA-binding NarL/FixJ family response regulator